GALMAALLAPEAPRGLLERHVPISRYESLDVRWLVEHAPATSFADEVEIIVALHQVGEMGDDAMPQSDQVGRNAPCHCGSGQRYKNCCGSLTPKTEILATEEAELPADLIETVKKARDNLRRRNEWPLLHSATPPSV